MPAHSGGERRFTRDVHFARPVADNAVPDSAWGVSGSENGQPEDWNSEFVAYERQRLIDALTEAKGNKSVAARLLGMPRSTFFSKVKKHGIA